MELFLLVALSGRTDDGRNPRRDGGGECRPWPAFLAADFEGSSPSIGEVAHCTEESRWWRCKSPRGHTSIAVRGRRSGEFRSWNGLSKCERIPDPSPRCSSSLKKAKAAAQGVPSWSPVGTVFEIRRTIREAVASPRRRAHEEGQVVGGSEPTCRTFAPIWQRESPHHPHHRFLQITHQELVQLRACKEGIGARAGRSSCTNSRCEARGAAVGSACCPIHLPIYSQESLQHGSVVNKEKSPFVECDGDVDRQCRLQG